MTCLSMDIMVIFLYLPWWWLSPENKKKGSFKFLLLSGFVCHVVLHSVLLLQMCETECLVFGLLLSNALS